MDTAHTPDTEYTIDNKTIHFNSRFEKSLTPSIYNILRNMDTMIFECNDGNYYKFEYDKMSIFDKPIDLPPNIRVLKLGHSFNQPIVLTLRMEILTFAHVFNQQIFLTPNIKILTFSTFFDKTVHLSKRILRLVFGTCFDQPINLSKNVVHMVFGFNFNKPISLGKKIQHLELDLKFTQSLVLTKNILSFRCALRNNLSCILSPYIEQLTLVYNNCSVVENIPDSVKSMILRPCFSTPINNMPQSVKKISHELI